MSPHRFMDPRLSAATLNVNDPSASDDKTQELSVSLSNNMEVISKELKVPTGKQTSLEDGLDQSSQSWGSPKSPKLDETKGEEHVSEIPFRKARVSVRARSEAPMVRN